MTTNELIEKYGIGHNCLSDAYDLGRADMLKECVDILNDSIPLVDNMDIIFGFKCAIERLEQIKE